MAFFYILWNLRGGTGETMTNPSIDRQVAPTCKPIFVLLSSTSLVNNTSLFS